MDPCPRKSAYSFTTGCYGPERPKTRAAGSARITLEAGWLLSTRTHGSLAEIETCILVISTKQFEIEHVFAAWS